MNTLGVEPGNGRLYLHPSPHQQRRAWLHPGAAGRHGQQRGAQGMEGLPKRLWFPLREQEQGQLPGRRTTKTRLQRLGKKARLAHAGGRGARTPAELWLSSFLFSFFPMLCFARRLQNPGDESKQPGAPFHPLQPRSSQAPHPSSGMAGAALGRRRLPSGCSDGSWGRGEAEPNQPRSFVNPEGARWTQECSCYTQAVSTRSPLSCLDQGKGPLAALRVVNGSRHPHKERESSGEGGRHEKALSQQETCGGKL